MTAAELVHNSLVCGWCGWNVRVTSPEDPLSDDPSWYLECGCHINEPGEQWPEKWKPDTF